MKTTTNLGLNKIDLLDSPPDITVLNPNWDNIDTNLNRAIKFQKAGGTGTAITLTNIVLTEGYCVTFIVTTANNAAATTINGKNLYKPGGTASPNLIAGKAVTVWYDATGDCFFIKASAEGDAVAANVLAEKEFSNDNDTGITGTMTDRGAITIMPGATDQVIPAGYHNGSGKVIGDADLVSSNIKNNVNIFGVIGTAKTITNCAQISNLSLSVPVCGGQIIANWTSPSDGMIKGVILVVKAGGYPTSPADGTIGYDSNDGPIATSCTISGLTNGSIYYVRGFAYTYQNATRLYTDITTGAQAFATPLNTKGQQIFTSSGTFTVPATVYSIQVFAVGGGGGGGQGYKWTAYNAGGCVYGGGGGGGYTKTGTFSVKPNDQYSVIVGAGGAAGHSGDGGGISGSGGAGGQSSFAGTLLVANGGVGAKTSGGDGGSGGGAGYYSGSDGSYIGGNGGYDGGNGNGGGTTSDSSSLYGIGQGSTTHAFGESSNTLYSGGGGGGSEEVTPYTGGSGGGGNGYYRTANSTGGQANTGGGGGGGFNTDQTYASIGGSGIVIVRWGY